MRLDKRLSALTLALLLPLAACGGEEEPGSGEACLTPTGTDHQFVVTQVGIPTVAAQATSDAYALDIDGTAEAQPIDNQLGVVLASLSGLLMSDIAGTVNEEIAAGSVIILANLKADDLAGSACAGMNVYLGANPNPAPCTDPADPTTCGKHLEGGASFEIDPASPQNASLAGTIAGGKFSVGLAEGDPRQVSLELALIEGQPPVSLALYGTRANFRVTDASLEGVLGGAIKETDLQTQVLPVIKNFIDGVLATDCTGTAPDCCTPDSNGALVLTTFDANEDCAVALEEIQNNTLIQSTLKADLDLFDGTGAFAADGEPDSLSLGIGFSATTATFTPAP